MKANRSIPPVTVIPVLGYPDVRAAVTWLTSAFGAIERVCIGDDHRVQMSLGEGAIIVVKSTPARSASVANEAAPTSIMIRVEDARECCARARSAGATIVHEPTDHMYGERQFSVEDIAGHRWTFTESIADVAPEAYGSTTIEAWRHS